MTIIPRSFIRSVNTRPVVMSLLRCDPDEIVTFGGSFPSNEIKMIRETGHDYQAYQASATRNGLRAHQFRRARPSMTHWLQDIEARNPGCKPPRAKLPVTKRKTIIVDLET